MKLNKNYLHEMSLFYQQHFSKSINNEDFYFAF
jgi:hypothetical protein